MKGWLIISCILHAVLLPLVIYLWFSHAALVELTVAMYRTQNQMIMKTHQMVQNAG